MLLSHYCRHKKDSNFPTTYSKVPDHNGHKRGGLWIGDEESGLGWKAFALENREKNPEQWKYHPEYGDTRDSLRFRYEFPIRLGQHGHIVIIQCLSDLDRFTEEYREKEPRFCLVGEDSGFGLHIDWRKVKQKFKGILITPYLKEARELDNVKYHWYKFDCASGCFWDTSCLEIVGWTGPICYD